MYISHPLCSLSWERQLRIYRTTRAFVYSFPSVITLLIALARAKLISLSTDQQVREQVISSYSDRPVLCFRRHIVLCLVSAVLCSASWHHAVLCLASWRSLLCITLCSFSASQRRPRIGWYYLGS